MTKFDNDDKIELLAHKAIGASLPKAEWTHAAHFALALWILKHRPELAEPDAMRGVIMRLNDSHGTPNSDSDGYHHTITIASLRAAKSVLDAHDKGAPLHEVLANLLTSPFARSDWILVYWTRELLFGVAARRDWVPPDLEALPF